MSGQRPLRQRLSESLIKLPWALSAAVMRLLYGFRIEGLENIPPAGPFIVLTGEYSLLGMLATNWVLILVLSEAQKRGESTQAYMQEQLWSMSYFRDAASKTPLSPLIPHSAGRMALNLLDGYRTLQEGGIVVMNPEGDVSWDGRPAPVRPGAAWLGLRTAAPIVPALTSTGNYDVWPRWQQAPSLRGQFVVTVGRPFRVCDSPQKRATPDGLAQALARIRGEFDRIRYGSGGLDEWAGAPLKDGQPVEQPIRLRTATPLVVDQTVNFSTPEKAGGGMLSLWKKGLALLLWRCPACGLNDALIHERHRFRPQSLRCQSCGSQWGIRRVVGKDFRLKVVKGRPDLLGLDMALSAWYDQMKADFEPSSIPASGVDLLPGEEVYLEQGDVSLLPYRPNPLFDGWTGREPPQARLPGKPGLADWDSIGEGRLLLTSQRLLWQGPRWELDFMWSSTTAVYIWLLNTLGIRYGTAPYRFSLGQEVGLKWLTYAGTVVQRVAERDGHTVTVTPF